MSYVLDSQTVAKKLLDFLSGFDLQQQIWEGGKIWKVDAIGNDNTSNLCQYVLPMAHCLAMVKEESICSCLCLAKVRNWFLWCWLSLVVFMVVSVAFVGGSIYRGNAPAASSLMCTALRLSLLSKVLSPLPFLKFCRAHILLEAFSLFWRRG